MIPLAGEIRWATNGSLPGPTYPFPFLVGCGRSGTTLLRAMLVAHPQMAIPHESYFVVPFCRNRRRYERRGGFDIHRFATDLFLHRWFIRWGLSDQEIERALADESPQTVADGVRAVFAAYARHREKTRYGDKTPSYVLNLPLLARLFPEGRFIHLIRDGRDVALSLLDVQFGPNGVEDAALFWKRHVARGRRAGRSMEGDRYLEIRYEDLVADPARCLRALCSFIDLRFDDSMLRYYHGAEDVVKDFRYPEEQRHLLQPPTKGLRDWRTQMQERDVVRFEAIAGDLLEDLGYERGVARGHAPSVLAARAREMALDAQWATRRVRKRLLGEG